MATTNTFFLLILCLVNSDHDNRVEVWHIIFKTKKKKKVLWHSHQQIKTIYKSSSIVARLTFLQRGFDCASVYKSNEQQSSELFLFCQFLFDDGASKQELHIQV